MGLTSSDGYRKLTSHLGPDPMVINLNLSLVYVQSENIQQEKSIWLPVYGSRLPGMLSNYFICSVARVITLASGLIRGVASWVVENVLGDTRFVRILRAARIKTFGEWSDYTVKRNEFIQEFYDKVSQMAALPSSF